MTDRGNLVKGCWRWKEKSWSKYLGHWHARLVPEKKREDVARGTTRQRSGDFMLHVKRRIFYMPRRRLTFIGEFLKRRRAGWATRRRREKGV